MVESAETNSAFRARIFLTNFEVGSAPEMLTAGVVTSLLTGVIMLPNNTVMVVTPMVIAGR